MGLPTDRTLVCEHFSDGAGEYQMLVHSLFGAQVNLPLGLMLQKAAVRLLGGDVRMHYSDDGILLHSTSAPLPEGLIYKICLLYTSTPTAAARPAHRAATGTACALSGA